jgi:hypothetical protein
MGRNQKARTAPVLKSLPPRKPQSSQDQQFEDRRRIVERFVQALREAGYSCYLGHARTLN